MMISHIVREDVCAIAERISHLSGLLSGKTILLTGGCGFLGRYMTAALLELNKRLEKPCTVVVVDNFITSIRNHAIFDQTDPHFTLIEQDVCDPLPATLEADFIIHAAGLASPFYYHRNPLHTIDVAVLGTKRLLEYARTHPVESILYFSSSEIYGDPPTQLIPTPETYWGNVSCLGPRACYDESKRLGETLSAVYHAEFGIPSKIVRPFNVYGPGGLNAQDFRVIPAFMTHGLAGKKMPVHGKGNQTRTFCYLTDAVVGFLLVLLKGRAGEAYNIGHDQDEINMMSLAHLISELIGKDAVAELIEYPKTYPAGEPQRRCPDLSKARQELGFSPLVSLRPGLARTLEWYQSLEPSRQLT